MKNSLKITPRHKLLLEQLENRILLLDGAMGTMLPKSAPADLLCVTQPETVGQVHKAYLDAGADIITTNSFNANNISLSDYDLQDRAYELALAAARLARREADKKELEDQSRPRFVAGTVGPTNKTASLSADIMNPASRDVTFDRLREAYAQQIEGLLDGGADIILIETVFDTLNAKAALYAISQIAEKRGHQIPTMISGTLSDASGRTLSGQTLEAFYTSVTHAPLLSIGLNCAFGPTQLRPYVERLSSMSSLPVSAHPNAGLPNELGEYDETPESFARKVRQLLEADAVNIIGGCCGTTPDHIREIAKFINQYPPRRPRKDTHFLAVSNLERLTVDGSSNFINIGERTNVAGSAKFARLIREGNYAEAVNIALRQIQAGAQIIDICMDDALIDGVGAMTTFLNLLASEPEIARVPVMIDSSEWAVIKSGLEVSQGKTIVNSISLKEGEEQFLRKAREIHKYGAAVVVMLFDESGQADTFEKKIKVAERSYKLLTSAGFPAEDIIFDPNILTIGTGIREHDNYGVDFIEATRWIKKNLPGVHVSGGVSNLSFAFRGNNPVREAIHSVFLYHAIEAGLDMAIVNSQMLRVYSEIEPELLRHVEDLVLNRRDDATERLIEYSASIKSQKDTVKSDKNTSELSSPVQRIEHKLLHGISDGIAEDVDLIMAEYSDGLQVIERVLMPVMDKIGDLFGSGKMFLPQVIKSARVLKETIGLIAPSIKTEGHSTSRGRVLAATVKGDIHDIGKNIVSLVAGCNGFEVIDLGVMVDAQKIADESEKIKPIAILLSGLITPSLAEMAEVCRELENRGLRIPVIVGGATTSALHTALKIAPEYSGPVFHSSDASHNSRILSGLVSESKDTFTVDNRLKQQRLVREYIDNNSSAPTISLEEARKRAIQKPDPSERSMDLGISIINDIQIGDIEEYIDWKFFLSSWGIKGKYPDILEDSKFGEEARHLIDDARGLLRKIKSEHLISLEAMVGVYEAYADKEDLVITTTNGEFRLPMLRSVSSAKNGECLTNYVSSENDYVILFALSAGIGLKNLIDDFRSRGDDYHGVMAKLIADRLAEAFAAKLSEKFEGTRFAFGYPSVPDHTLKRDVFDILNVEKLTSMRLTENAMITPEESICGIILPEAEYFTLGKIGDEQLELYAAKRNITVQQLKKLLPTYLLAD